jgi:hypothetical protein
MSRTILIAAALALAATLPAVQAQALAPRTFVSAAGTDNSTCSFAAPCRHFQAAVDATSAGGEVDALDPAGYGPIVISQAITIEGQGWSYAAPSADSPAITINAVSGNVYIHGVSLNGVGITGNTTGILFNSGGALYVRDSVIRNFNLNGIKFAPNSASQISVANTQISDNGGDGVQVLATSITVRGLFNHVSVENNTAIGLDIRSSPAGARASVTISDCVSATNGTGISASDSSSGGGTFVMVRNSTIANNLNSGLAAVTAGSIVVTRSMLFGNNLAWTTSGAGTLISFGDNTFFDDLGNDVAPPETVPYD